MPTILKITNRRKSATGIDDAKDCNLTVTRGDTVIATAVATYAPDRYNPPRWAVVGDSPDCWLGVLSGDIDPAWYCDIAGYIAAGDAQGVLEEPDSLTADVDDTSVAVHDAEGGVWVPDTDTAAEILASEDPAATAIRICDREPMRGSWHQ